MRPHRLRGFDYLGHFHYSLTMCTFERRHVFVEAPIIDEDADLVRFAKRSRQRSAYALRHRVALPLWQDGYYEHVLRDHERLATTIRYVADNPVRAGLVERWDDYPFTDSQLGDLQQVLEWLDEHDAPDEDALLGLEEEEGGLPKLKLRPTDRRS